MHTFVQYLVDFIFPPSAEELKLRTLSPEQFFAGAKPAPQPEFPFISSVFPYKDPLVREMIWQIKYKKDAHAVKIAGYALYAKLAGNATPVVLIPIPISRKRRKERGYNQCELLVDEIMRLDNEKKFTKDYRFLLRDVHIERQTLKNRAERIENTREIFSVSHSSMLAKDTRIILIDDVTTTGSTLNEAKKACIEAGFSNITALSVAH